MTHTQKVFKSVVRSTWKNIVTTFQLFQVSQSREGFYINNLLANTCGKADNSVENPKSSLCCIGCKNSIEKCLCRQLIVLVVLLRYPVLYLRFIIHNGAQSNIFAQCCPIVGQCLVPFIRYIQRYSCHYSTRIIDRKRC